MVRCSACARFPFLRSLENSFFFLMRRYFISVLRGDVLSALVSPSLEGVSAALRLHSLAEPVHLASLALLGLIRSLHSKLLLI